MAKRTVVQTPESQIANRVIKDLDFLRGSRSNWESHWQEIAERIWPNHSRLFQGQYLSAPEGEKRTEHIFDSTPSIALNRFASILDSLLTPQNQMWHRLAPSNKDLLKDREAALWFEEATNVLFKLRRSPLSNFAGQNNLNFKMLGAYGSGCVFVDKLNWHKEVGIRYRSMHLSGVYFRENHQGIVDTVYRHYNQKARNAKQEWGDKLPKKILEAAEKTPDKEFQFIHCVEPRGEDYDPQRGDHKSMLFASYYVSTEGKVLLEESGYRSFPYPTARYEQVPGEAYGRGPAMDVLPAIKTLNAQKKVVLEQGHRTVRPVLLTHDDGIIDTFSMRPGAMNAGGMTADGRPLVGTLPVGNIAIGKELMDDERAVINDANLVTLFQILVETPQMTATEVMERTREKGILIAPTLGRVQSEYLGSLIEREIDLAMSMKLLPDMPPALAEANGEYRIEYESPLSRTARAEEAAGTMRTIEFALNFAAQSQNPAILDHFNTDEILPGVADTNGMPAKYRNGADIIAQIRDGRAKQAQQAQAITAAPGVAALMKADAVSKKNGASAA